DGWPGVSPAYVTRTRPGRANLASAPALRDVLAPPAAPDQDLDGTVARDPAGMQQHVGHQADPHLEKMHVVAGTRHVGVVHAHLARERLAVERPAFAERLRLQLLRGGIARAARRAVPP